MKSFFQFLTEATQSQASMQAKKLGLKGDGHGGWIDRAGKVVARTEKGKLKFTEKRTSKGQEEPEADTQKSAAPETKPKAKAAPASQSNSSTKQQSLHLKINHKKLHHLLLYLEDLIHQQ
jgi:hypothetical protein